MGQHTARLSVSLSPKLLADAKQAARIMDTTLSKTVRDALRRLVAEAVDQQQIEKQFSLVLDLAEGDA